MPVNIYFFTTREVARKLKTPLFSQIIETHHILPQKPVH